MTQHRPSIPSSRSASSSNRFRVYALRLRHVGARMIAVALLLALPVVALGACMHHFVTEPFNLWGEQTPAPITQSSPPTPDQPYALQTAPPYTVALDAGHGGNDTGAPGLLPEVEVCEKTTNELFSLLRADENYRPVRTRNNGTDLSTNNRAAMATAYQASLLLSIHANYDSQTRQSHGFECFPTPPGRIHFAESLRFAGCLTQSMRNAGHRLRGENGIRFLYYNNGGNTKKIVESSDTNVRSQKSFGMVEKPHCPAVLVEQCFLSNAADVDQWASDAGCKQTAQVYYEAICSYFGTNRKAR